MKLSNYSLNYASLIQEGKFDIFKFLSLCGQLGLDGASLHIANLESTKEDYLKKVRRAYLDNGLSLSLFTVSTDFGKPAEQHAAELVKAREAMRVAMLLGAPLLRVFAGSPPSEKERDAAFRRAAASVRKLCEEAAQLGLPIGLQNHNHGALCRTGEECVRFIEQVNHPNLVFILDCGQFAGSKGASGAVPADLKDADYLASIRLTAGLARYVRAKFYNPALDGGEPFINYDEVFNILRTVHYRGFIDIVYEPVKGPAGPGESVLQAIPRIAKYLAFKIHEVEIAPPARIVERYETLDNGEYFDPVEVRVETPVAFLEGPTVDAAGDVYFTNVPAERIMKWEPKARRLSVFREKSNEANGLRFDAQNRLIACEGGAGRVTRTDLKTGKIEVLCADYEGKPLGAPNDLELDAQGRIYFTSRLANSDPKKGNINAVYRINPDGKVERLLAYPRIDMPNGIALSPSERVLYLIDADGREGRSRKIRAYDLTPDGTLAGERVLYDFYPGRSGDGMKVDRSGNLYVAAGLHRRRGTHETLETLPGIHVISPAGKLVAFLQTPEDTITNCAFGGPDLKTLYVTCGKLLLSMTTKLAGKASYRIGK